MSFAYGFLYYLESVGIDDVRLITAFTVSDYISSAHFKNRAPNGVSTEIIGIRHFLRFLEDRDFIKKAFIMPALAGRTRAEGSFLLIQINR
jgi:hypothetical protein